MKVIALGTVLALICLTPDANAQSSTSRTFNPAKFYRLAADSTAMVYDGSGNTWDFHSGDAIPVTRIIAFDDLDADQKRELPVATSYIATEFADRSCAIFPLVAGRFLEPSEVSQSDTAALRRANTQYRVLQAKVERAKDAILGANPDLANPRTTLGKAMQERLEWIRRNKPSLLSDPEWPTHVAQSALESTNSQNAEPGTVPSTTQPQTAQKVPFFEQPGSTNVFDKERTEVAEKDRQRAERAHERKMEELKINEERARHPAPVINVDVHTYPY
jgi:hypothetical protein